MKSYFGLYVYGLAAVGFGVVALVWGDFNDWQQIRASGGIPHREILLYLAAAVEIFGGIAIQFRRTERVGAIALGAIYVIFALMWVPIIVHDPRVFDRYANFFEQFSLVAGAMIVGRSFSPRASGRAALLARIGYFSFGICVISFTLEQAFHLSGTPDFVPKWIAPGQMFRAVTTTVAFALAAVALLTGRFALLAARLLTTMIVGFGLLVWLPAPFADPHKLINWAGNAENLAIAGSAWIMADYLRQRVAARAMITAQKI
jgi:uncharacterized membrane protein YphA (DoxX/SURF4 family)